MNTYYFSQKMCIMGSLRNQKVGRTGKTSENSTKVTQVLKMCLSERFKGYEVKRRFNLCDQVSTEVKGNCYCMDFSSSSQRFTKKQLKYQLGNIKLNTQSIFLLPNSPTQISCCHCVQCFYIRNNFYCKHSVLIISFYSMSK